MEEKDVILEAIKIKKLVDESEAMALWLKFQQGRSSYLIFLDNSKAVRDSIRKLNSIPMGELEIDTRWKMQRRIVKDLHNVISSGQNFLDHLKHTHNFCEAVHDKIYSTFFRELRNYLVHNDVFKLVTRNEYKINQAPKFYQAMDKSTFAAFINLKTKIIYEKIQLDPSKVSKREKELFSELFSLGDFLDEQETLFDFEPVLDQYTISLNVYYSKWVLTVLKKKIKLSVLKKFTEDMKTVNKNLKFSFSKTRLRYLQLAVIIKERYSKKPTNN